MATKPDLETFLNAMHRHGVATADCQQFTSGLDALVAQSTHENIQICSKWIVKHATQDPLRLSVLMTYLQKVSEAAIEAPVGAVAQRRRALLLLVSDLLHATKVHVTPHLIVTARIVRAAAALLKLAVTVAPTASEAKKLQDLVNHWATSGWITNVQFDELRISYTEGLLAAQGGGPPWLRTYKLPKEHGIRDAAWHHLPASLMAEELLRNPTQPVALRNLEPKRLTQPRASPSIRAQLDKFFEVADLVCRPTGDNVTGETGKFHLWLDDMGQLVAKDKVTEDIEIVCNGYGWSRDFARQMMEDGIPTGVTQGRNAYGAGPNNRPTSSESDRDGYAFARRPSSRDYEDRHQNDRRRSHHDTKPYDRPSRYYGDRRTGANHDGDPNKSSESGPRVTANNNGSYDGSYNDSATMAVPQGNAYHQGNDDSGYRYQANNNGGYSGYGHQANNRNGYSGYGHQANNHNGYSGYEHQANNNSGYSGYGHQANYNNGYHGNDRSSHSSRGGYQSGYAGGYQGRGGNRGGNRGHNHGGHRRGNQSSYHRGRGGRYA